MRKPLFQLIGWITCCSVVILTKPVSAELVARQPDCRDPQTQQDMNLCAANASQAADRALNQVYRRVQSAYDRTALGNLLVEAQLAWIKFRDENCKFAQQRYAGGSIAPMIEQSCIERLTRQRTEELESFLERG
ncbi:MAG: DUF1311 domain-containing protein [Myxacorys chilensis ATA2-1-KO14]|nr:DUF1311 domain-containing protein [Myxacorys chilensis ATA2-1-KO14]